MYEKALEFARKAHASQKRKITGEKYFSHPFNVARILSSAGFPEYVVAAGLLHDVVEDTDVTRTDIVNEFGEKTANLVMAHTEDKSKSWEERKSHTIETVRNGNLEVKALIVADKLDNLSSIRYAMSMEGNRVWNHFKRGYNEQKWYYMGVLDAMTTGLSEEEIPAFFTAYERLVHTVFRR
ncbi:HD domain-containing protein [Listeria kieliensis]|uniref:Phosphohydrolase n=1 Tax=Listeria kieliensis TaxID=1621700 RepID=A0A3D8TST1_9LIST|nr:HD domain-containing protein [Listeria kieliensis]RDX02126.1 phosphohydrolase [Listeria kieliensis]